MKPLSWSYSPLNIKSKFSRKIHGHLIQFLRWFYVPTKHSGFLTPDLMLLTADAGFAIRDPNTARNPVGEVHPGINQSRNLLTDCGESLILL